MRPHALMLLFLFLTGFLSATDAGLNLNEPLPADPSYIVKKLDNGLTYYIRTNKKPENRAELRLVLNAGSMQEDDDQLGLAHFIEHMAFNGSTNFSKNELVDYLQGAGMRFGPHLNAVTSFDRTVYMLRVPTDQDDVLAKGFQILEDWAHGLTLDAEEIDKERGVVIEEWRSNRGAGMRMFEKQMPLMFKGSRYANRLPIGKVEILESAPREAVQRFYKDWYRPDLMAVVAVGDFDAAVIEKYIVDHFSKIPAAKNPRERKVFPVPGHKDTLFSIETDPELTSSSINVMHKHAPVTYKTVGDYRKLVIENLSESLFNQRLSELTREADPPFLGAYAGASSFVRSLRSYSLNVSVKEGHFEQGFVTLLREMKRVKQHGFTQSELDRARKQTLRSLEVAYNERDKSDSRTFVSTCISHFLEGEALIEIDQIFPLFKAILPTITLEELNTASDGMMTEENRVVMITAPEKEGLAVPTRDEVLSWFDKAEKLTLEPYKDKVSDAPLVQNPPKPGKVVEEKKHERVGVTEWKLSNGVRVVLKPTDFKNDQVMFTSFSEGGTSLAPDADYRSVAVATSLIRSSGPGRFDVDELRKKLAGKVAGANPGIGAQTESISGGGSPADLETALQLAYLYFTEPKITERAHKATLAQWENFVRNRLKRPGTVFGDAVMAKLYQNHPRYKPWTVELLKQVDPDKALAFYKDRFADASDFTFIFVGNFELDKIKPMIETWLGGLPAIDRKESWRDLGVELLKGKHNLVVRKGLEPRATVSIRFHGDHPYNAKDRYAMSSLNEALNIRFTKLLREEMGGVYGASVSGGLSRWPKGNFNASIDFTCDPERAQELITVCYTELERLAKEGFEEETVKKVKEAQMRSYEEGLERNSFWQGNLSFRYRHGLDPNGILDYPKERVETLTKETLQKAVKTFYLGPNRLESLLLPEEGAAESKGGE